MAGNEPVSDKNTAAGGTGAASEEPEKVGLVGMDELDDLLDDKQEEKDDPSVGKDGKRDWSKVKSRINTGAVRRKKPSSAKAAEKPAKGAVSSAPAPKGQEPASGLGDLDNMFSGDAEKDKERSPEEEALAKEAAEKKKKVQAFRRKQEMERKKRAKAAAKEKKEREERKAQALEELEQFRKEQLAKQKKARPVRGASRPDARRQPWVDPAVGSESDSEDDVSAKHVDTPQSVAVEPKEVPSARPSKARRTEQRRPAPARQPRPQKASRKRDKPVAIPQPAAAMKRLKELLQRAHEVEQGMHTHAWWKSDCPPHSMLLCRYWCSSRTAATHASSR